MKTVNALCLWSLIPAFLVSATGEPASAETSCAPSDLVRAESARRPDAIERSRAPEPRSWAKNHLAALEKLQKSVVQKDRALEAEVEDALKSAREEDGPESQSALRRTILERNWIWRSDDDGNGVVTVFHGDGSVEHIGLRGAWQITGPNEVTISAEGDGQYVLRFDPDLRGFVSDRHGISGMALPSAAETLCANIWSLRGDQLEFRRNGALVQRGEGWEGRDWRLSEDGIHVTINFANGNGGTFAFQNGTLTHFDGTPFQRTPKE